MVDLLIAGGRIVDGSGTPWFEADIGIQGGKIAKIGPLRGEAAQERIDLGGLFVSPGFIDIHSHSDAVPFISPREEGKILQGVTTEAIGNCGVSLAPATDETRDLLKKYTVPFSAGSALPWNWETMGGFLDLLEERRSFTNIVSLVGHGTIRIAVMGFANRKPRPEELEAMKRLVARAMDDGAFGLSSGLIYPPGIFSDTAEMTELCKVVTARGGLYTTHMRNENDGVIDSVRETIEVGEKSGVSVQISHHKTSGRGNWGKSRETLRLVDEARQRGLDITCDVYPYIASHTFLRALLPPWMQEGGVLRLLERLRFPEHRRRIKEDFASGLPGWSNLYKSTGWDQIVISSCRKNRDLEGRNVQEIAASRKAEPAEVVFDVLLEEEGDVEMLLFGMAEDDVTYILKHPAAMVGSDAIPSAGKPHPRFYGTFPRVLGKYVREDKALTLPEGVRKMTSLPAQKLGLRDRGLVKVGMWADLVVFDPETIADRATFSNPRQYPPGIHYVLVNGQITAREGRATGALPGKILRKNQN
jgi:N-acyl-D-amino-acid deacylase